MDVRRCFYYMLFIIHLEQGHLHFQEIKEKCMENSRQNFLGFPLSLQFYSYFVAFEQVEGKSLTKFQLWATLAISGVRSHIKADVL